jgi:hypothetical protein
MLLVSDYVTIDALAKEREAINVLAMAGGEQGNGPGLVHTTLRSISAQLFALCWRANSILVEICNNGAGSRLTGSALRASGLSRRKLRILLAARPGTPPR